MEILAVGVVSIDADRPLRPPAARSVDEAGRVRFWRRVWLGTRPACGDGWLGGFARVFSGCGSDRCQGLRCSTRCFVLQRLVGSVAERFRSGAAAAAKEDRGLVGEVVFVSVGVDDSLRPSIT